LALKKFRNNGVFKTIHWKIGIIVEGWQFARAAYLTFFTVHPTSNRRWATTGFVLHIGTVAENIQKVEVVQVLLRQ
jgi:hypothetical protein